MLCLCGAAAAIVGALRAGNVVDAAHDAGTARVLGLVPQPWRALDVVVGWLFAILPVGTRVARAEMGGAVVVGLAAAALCDISRRLLSHCAPAPRLAPLIAAIATLSAVLETAWQREGPTVGGSSTGAALVLGTVALTLRAIDQPTRTRTIAVMVALGLSCGHEALVGVTALGAVAILVTSNASHGASLAKLLRADLPSMTTFGLLGLGPFVVAIFRTRSHGDPLVPSLLHEWAGERGASGGASLLHFLSENLGGVGAAMAGAGLVIGLLALSARPLALAMTVLSMFGIVSIAVGVPVGPTRVGAPVLVALAAAWALASVGLQRLVLLVDGARVPFARAAASMVVLLEIVLPVEAADAWLASRRPRTDAWDALVWGRLPPNAVVLLSTPRTYERAQAAWATGAFPAGVTIVPAFPGGTFPTRPLLADPSWRHLGRDLALDGKPSEAALAALADKGPLEVAYDFTWDRALARHLVPDGLLDRYTSEPRGTSDRGRALDTFRSVRDDLALVVAQDPDLAEVTVAFLRSRVAGYIAGGERDLALRAADDARWIAPVDPATARLVEWARSSGGGGERTRGR